jgi:acetyl-CoA/propionyl-CoA carboxylase biotin carboxyl carrier protein
VLLGLGTNIGYLRALLADPDVRAGNLDTGLVGRKLEQQTTRELPEDVLGAATGVALLDAEPTGAVVDPFDIPGGWRIGEDAWTTRRLVVSGHEPVEVRSRGRAAAAEVVVDGGEPVVTTTEWSGSALVHRVGGISRSYAVARDAAGVLWIGRDGQSWEIRDQEALAAAAEEAAGAGGPIVSPMPGTVTVVEVTEGQQVTVGQTLVVVEAMKMEHVLTAPVDGVVRELRARTGGTVAKDAVLLVVEPGESDGS